MKIATNQAVSERPSGSVAGVGQHPGNSATVSDGWSDGQPVIVQNYPDLVAKLIERRHELGLSQLDVDHISGMQDGYTGKLELGYGPGGRTMGAVSTARWLRALGRRLALVAVENDDEA